MRGVVTEMTGRLFAGFMAGRYRWPPDTEPTAVLEEVCRDRVLVRLAGDGLPDSVLDVPEGGCFPWGKLRLDDEGQARFVGLT